ncbi:MAG: hypothetical protein L0322_00570 [Chloroflexi bacterium]|nr:hypothetical protein [Chloroflexota bacterium]
MTPLLQQTKHGAAGLGFILLNGLGDAETAVHVQHRPAQELAAHFYLRRPKNWQGA